MVQSHRLLVYNPRTRTCTDTAQKDAQDAVLRSFDLNMDFGPCVGITRLQRWERAKRNGLSPPEDVHAILLDIEKDGTQPDRLNNVWNTITTL